MEKIVTEKLNKNLLANLLLSLLLLAKSQEVFDKRLKYRYAKK